MVWKKSSERKTLFVQSWVWVDEDDLSLVNCEGGAYVKERRTIKGKKEEEEKVKEKKGCESDE